jgi:sulfatase maturation enzyme AslB (radical SAM superfamily)
MTRISSLARKLKRGLPYLGKELRAVISDRTRFFVAVPRAVHIWRGAPCNARCIMCTYGYFKGQAYRELSSSPFTDAMMPRALEEIQQLCGRGTLVSYMGGEPTTSRHLAEWIEQAGRLGLDFRFTTNGYLMTEELARRLVASGLFNLGISLESLDPEINEALRPFPKGTARTLRCIELLLRERERQGRHLSLNLKTVLTDLNLESFVEIAKRFGRLEGVMCTPQVFEVQQDMPPETRQRLAIKDVNRLRKVTDEIRALKNQGYTIHATDQALAEMVKQCAENPELTQTMHDKRLEMDPSEPPCNIATDNLWIEHGLVRLCPYHPPIGSFIADTSTALKTMWRSETALRVRAGTRACRRLCTISCLRRTPLSHKVSTFLKIA